MDQQTQVAPQASLQDRIANAFGGGDPKPKAPAPRQEAPAQIEQPTETEAASGETTEEVEATSAPAEETFELEIEGEKYVLPKKLEKGFMQERDYTQKAQTLAETRKQVELVQEQARIAQMRATFDQSLASELQQLAAYDWALEQAKSTNWASLSTEEMLRKKLEFDGYKDQRETLHKQIEGKRQEFFTAQLAEIQKIKAQSLDVLKKRIPNWGEDTMKAVRAHALQDGYTEAELASILDPRHAMTLWKAQQFDQLQAQAKPSVAAAKIVKTSPTNPMPQHVKDKLNFRKVLQKAPPGSPERKRAVEDRVAGIFSR